MVIARTGIFAVIVAIAFAGLTHAQDSLDPKSRQELKRADLTGTNMEVIISVIENQPGLSVISIMARKRSMSFRAQRSKRLTVSRSLSRQARAQSIAATFHMRA